MKFVLLLFGFLLMASGSAFADAYPEEWTICKKDSDCVKSYACEDIALNKDYVNDFQDAFDEGCDGSIEPNPKAMAKCIDKECTIHIPDEKK
jgi:hypothetical protein